MYQGRNSQANKTNARKLLGATTFSGRKLDPTELSWTSGRQTPVISRNKHTPHHYVVSTRSPVAVSSNDDHLSARRHAGAQLSGRRSTGG